MRQQSAVTADSSSAAWHTIINIHGEAYPTRHYAPNIDGSSDDSFDLAAPQLNYMRAIHEAGHAVTALIGRAHLHFARITLGVATSARSGVAEACNFSDGRAFAVFSAAGERAVNRWLRENDLWTPGRAVAAEVGAYGDRRLFLSTNPHVGYGDREVDYRMIHDLADQALDEHWAAVIRVADRLTQRGRLSADTIVALTGLPNGQGSAQCPLAAHVEPAPAVDVPEPLTEPRRDWDDDPRTCARYDRYWFDRDED